MSYTPTPATGINGLYYFIICVFNANSVPHTGCAGDLPQLWWLSCFDAAQTTLTLVKVKGVAMVVA